MEERKKWASALHGVPEVPVLTGAGGHDSFQQPPTSLKQGNLANAHEPPNH
jgi:hypothetical protein